MAWQIRNAKKMELFTSPYAHIDETGERRIKEIQSDEERFISAPSSGDAASIKAAFTKWDADGSGTIDKYELMMVMRLLCHVDDHDLEALMSECDTNGDGEISYLEFVDWLMAPAVESQGKALFDYAQVLQPMFEAYDRNGTGVITYEEFEECHSVLKGAMRVEKIEGYSDSDSDSDGGKAAIQSCPSCGSAYLPDSEFCRNCGRKRVKEMEREIGDPLLLHKDAEEAFQLCDSNMDRRITFREFVNWMRVFIDEAGIEKEQLKVLAARVGQMLSSCFKQLKIVEDCNQPGDQPDKDEMEALTLFVKTLARNTVELNKALIPKDYEAPKGTEWSEPPMGLNVDRLKGTHMRYFPLDNRRLRKVDKVHMFCLCVPVQGGEDKPDTRIWLGEVIRKFELKEGRRRKAGRIVRTPPEYYVYDREKFRWLPLRTPPLDSDRSHPEPQSEILAGAAAFKEALNALDVEMKIFCLLKTEANFGTQLSWRQVVDALDAAEDLGFLTDEQCRLYTEHVAMVAMQVLEKDGVLTDEDGEETRRKSLDEFLSKAKIRPRMVMATLSELDIVKINQVWQEFVSAD